jgi:transposase-like protein
MAGRPSKYDADDKARVLVALKANGGNVKRTARETGVPEQTVRNWKKEGNSVSASVALAVPLAEDEFVKEASLIRSKALKLIEQKIEDGDAKVGELNAVVGTLTDKIRLINGEATSRTESVHHGPSPEEFGARLLAYVEDAANAQALRQADIIDAEFEETEVVELPSG